MILAKYATTIQLLKQIILFLFNHSLYYFFYQILGLNKYLINFFLIKTGISKNMLIKNIPNSKFLKLCHFVNMEGKTNISFNIDKNTKFNYLKELNVYKGIRLKKGLPLNGQRTHSNGKTAKYLLKKI